ncbi:UDP-glucose 4-epimerase GalE [Candidatus Pelagibacter sp. HIMB1746]|uniref:UDP-glucose 4-epimerase GalE n=1 Tax=Candidatus Pelagibacter sp. HIMB1746 TaxID=3413370 RepID=UPI003F82D7A1
MKPNILLTGGAGYIGSHVAQKLIDSGFSVTIIDNLITGNLKLVPKKAILKICDIDDTKKISKILNSKSFTAVLHFAGLIRVDESVKFPKKYFLYNYNKSKDFIETCISHGLNKIIFSSTASVYGKPKSIEVRENDKLNPINPYAKSKLRFENYLIKKKKQGKLNYVILRYFNVAGADSKLRSGLISKYSTHLIKVACEVAVGKKKKLIINGNNYNTRDGTPVRDYIHVSDLAEMHIKCLNYMIKSKRSDIFNCGYGRGYSVNEVIENLEKILGRKIKIEIGPRRLGDTPHVVSNISKFKRKFSFKPKFDDIKIILKSALLWEKKLKKIR